MNRPVVSYTDDNAVDNAAMIAKLQQQLAVLVQKQQTVASSNRALDQQHSAISTVHSSMLHMAAQPPRAVRGDEACGSVNTFLDDDLTTGTEEHDFVGNLAEEQRLAAETTSLAQKKQLADEQRIAADKTRLAAEKARLAEEQLAAEKARLAEENARLAGEARLAAEKARLAKEQLAAEERLAAEKARLAKEQLAAEKARLAEEQLAAEKARLAEEQLAAEKTRLADREKPPFVKRDSKLALTTFVNTTIRALDNATTLSSDSAVEHFVAELYADGLTIGFLKYTALFWTPNVEFVDAEWTRYHHLVFKYIDLIGPRLMRTFAPENRLRSLEIARSLTFYELMHHMSQLRVTEQVAGDHVVFMSALEKLKMCDKSNVAFLNGQQIFRMKREKWTADFGLTTLQARVLSAQLYTVLQNNGKSQDWHIKLFTSINASTAVVAKVDHFVKCDVYDANGVGDAKDAAFLGTLTETARNVIVAQRQRKQQHFKNRFEANLQKSTVSASAAKKTAATKGKRPMYNRYQQLPSKTGENDFGIGDNSDAESSGGSPKKRKHQSGASKDSAKRHAAKQYVQRPLVKKTKATPKPKVNLVRLNTDELLLKQQLRNIVDTFVNTDVATLSTLSSALAALQHQSIRVCTMQKKFLHEDEQVAKPTATCPDCPQKLSSFNKMFVHQRYECEFECMFSSCSKTVTEEHEATCIIGQRLNTV